MLKLIIKNIAQMNAVELPQTNESCKSITRKKQLEMVHTENVKNAIVSLVDIIPITSVLHVKKRATGI